MTIRAKLRRACEEGGFAASVQILVAALLLLVLGGLSIDMWRVLNAHQRLVAITDAAAVAGAGGIDVEHLYQGGIEPILDEAEASGRACSYVNEALGAFVCPGPTATVSVDPHRVTVEMRTRVPMGLLRLMVLAGGGAAAPFEIAARAVASPVRVPPPGG